MSGNSEAVKQHSDKEEEELNSDDNEKGLLSEYSFKHPLQNSWTLWFFKKDDTRKWEDMQTEIASFSTAEDFWALYNHIESASKLKNNCDYSLFKQGIKPMWEDEQNKYGGRWLLNLNRSQRYEIDSFWIEILLLLIGEGFEDFGDDVNGAVVNLRNRGDKIGLWTNGVKNQDGIVKIGRILKQRLSVPPDISIGFQSHRDSQNKSGSSIKNMYTL